MKGRESACLYTNWDKVISKSRELDNRYDIYSHIPSSQDSEVLAPWCQKSGSCSDLERSSDEHKRPTFSIHSKSLPIIDFGTLMCNLESEKSEDYIHSFQHQREEISTCFL